MSRWVRALLLGVLMIVCTGCLRYNAQLQLDADGTVSGSFVVAVKGDLPVNLIARSDIPPSLQRLVTVQNYQADGYVGSQVSFQRLSMEQLSELFDGGQRSGATIQLSMSRSNNEVSLSGAVWFPDLSFLSGSNDGYDSIITFSFPGAETLTSNGKVAGTQVSWSPRPGELAQLEAHASYPAPTVTKVAAPAGHGTTVAFYTGIAAILVGLLALAAARLLRRPAAVAASGHSPESPADPYAGRYPTVPSGPGLSPESTLRHPTAPLDEPPDQ
jgi:LppM domain